MTARSPFPRSQGARTTWLTLWLAATLAGCQVPPGQPGGTAPQPPGPQPARLGTVRVVAPPVFVSSRPIQGTVTLNDGDKVATGPVGRAHVELPGRGTVDLEPATDPWFIREGACVVVRILFGGALVSGHNLCVEDEEGTRVALNSAVHVQAVKGGETRFTVVEGTAQLQRVARVPTKETLPTLQRVTIANGRVQQRIAVPRTEVDLLRQRLKAPAGPIVR